MIVTVVQMEDRDQPLRNFLLAYNRLDAARRGMRYVHRTTGYDALPPYWWKVRLLNELLNDKEIQGDSLWLWLDSDAYLGPRDPRSVAAAAAAADSRVEFRFELMAFVALWGDE